MGFKRRSTIDDRESTGADPAERCSDRVLQVVLEPLGGVAAGLSEVEALASAVGDLIVEIMERGEAPESGEDTLMRRLDSLGELLTEHASSTHQQFRTVLGNIESDVRRVCSDAR